MVVLALHGLAVHAPVLSHNKFVMPSAFDETIKQIQSVTVKPDQEVTWRTIDLLIWKSERDDSHLLRKKAEFVEAYMPVIRQAADANDIPAILLAGIAWREFGGDPMWIDDVAYRFRLFDHAGDAYMINTTLTKKQEQTSFGNLSIQVRRAAQALGFDYDELPGHQHEQLIKMLKDPVQNIFIAAKHIADMRDIDFYGKPASALTNDELKIITSRYHLGPDYSLEQVQANAAYGENVLRRYKQLATLIDPQPEPDHALLAKHTPAL